MSPLGFSSLCKISSEIEKNSLEYHSIILTEILTEGANCSWKYLFCRYKQKTARKTQNLFCAEIFYKRVSINQESTSQPVFLFYWIILFFDFPSIISISVGSIFFDLEILRSFFILYLKLLSMQIKVLPFEDCIFKVITFYINVWKNFLFFFSRLSLMPIVFGLTWQFVIKEFRLSMW